MHKTTLSGAYLRDARLARKLSLRALGQATGIVYSSISRYETGERAIPRSDLGPLGEALGMTAGDAAGLRRLWDLDMDAREAK